MLLHSPHLAATQPFSVLLVPVVEIGVLDLCLATYLILLRLRIGLSQHKRDQKLEVDREARRQKRLEEKRRPAIQQRLTTGETFNSLTQQGNSPFPAEAK